MAMNDERDEKIIELFLDRSESAIAELSEKYGGVLLKLSKNILLNEEDAEECVNDAYFGVWNKIPPERPNPLITYVCKIVRNISLKKYYRENAEKRGSKYRVAMDEIESVAIPAGSIENETETGMLRGYLEEFLDDLSYEKRVLFMRRYWFGDSYRDIAELTGLSEKNVSVSLSRLRAKLRDFLIEKGVFL